MPAAEAMLMMHPPPPSFMALMACRVPTNTPSRFVASTRRQSARLVSVIGRAKAMPAQLTAMSRRPHSARIRAIAACQSVCEVTSSRKASAWPPPAQIASATCAESGSFRSAKATLAPASARRLAVALPMPEAAPVTRATLPTMRWALSTFAMCHGCHGNEAVASPHFSRPHPQTLARVHTPGDVLRLTLETAALPL